MDSSMIIWMALALLTWIAVADALRQENQVRRLLLSVPSQIQTATGGQDRLLVHPIRSGNSLIDNMIP